MFNDTEQLLARALAARESACAAYSNYKVGAALQAADGSIYTGCNIESSSYGLTVCAERVALWKALSEGQRHFTAIAVVTTSNPPAMPCGACRQLLWEYCGDIEVVAVNLNGRRKPLRLSSLFPHPFDPESLRQA